MRMSCPTKVNKTRCTRCFLLHPLLQLVIMIMHALPALGALAVNDGTECEKEEVVGETVAAQSLVSDGTRLVLNPSPTPHPAHPAHCNPDHPSRPCTVRSAPASVISPTASPNTFSYSSLATHLDMKFINFTPSWMKPIVPNMTPPIPKAEPGGPHHGDRHDWNGIVRSQYDPVSFSQTADPAHGTHPRNTPEVASPRAKGAPPAHHQPTASPKESIGPTTTFH